MRLYYWNARPNFGDALTSLLISRFTRITPVYTTPDRAELIVIGSILEHLPPYWTGIVAGAGKLHEETKLKLEGKILALRGPLSARGIKGDFVLGDPGLLADELVSISDKKYDLGIVPHWTDTKLGTDPRFKQYKPLIINPSDDPLKVITEIGQCRKIISSSLHGIVLADAFGIPRRTEIAPKMLSHPRQEGGLFKFKDYNASINVKFEIGLTQEADRNVIADKQSELFDIFEEIKSIFS